MIDADLIPNQVEDASDIFVKTGLAGAENWIFSDPFTERLRFEIDRSGDRGPRGSAPPRTFKAAPRITARYGSTTDCAITAFQPRLRSVRALRHDRKPDALRCRVAKVRAYALLVEARDIDVLDHARDWAHAVERKDVAPKDRPGVV